MKGKKKGISSILGALIFLQILLISLLLVIHVISNETNVTLKSVQRFQVLSENAPVEEEVENNIAYLYSTTPFVITHVIYPNGEIVNTSIVVNNKYLISRILNGFPWAIIVTSKGTWYNVTPLGDNNYDSGLITFPNYHDYGQPLDPSVLKVIEEPNWNVLEGIASPSAFSLVPVNVTIGDPTTYNWGLTDAVLVVYPLSSDGWINITYYAPNVNVSVSFPSNNPYGEYCTYYIYAKLGIYIPTNVTMTIEQCTLSKIKPQMNESALEYAYIYIQDYEITDIVYFTGSAWINCGGGYFYPAIGTIGNAPYPPGPVVCDGVYPHFPSYPLSDWLANNPISNITIPPSCIFDKVHPSSDPIKVNAEIFVFQTDINLYKGIVLNYGYDSHNNSWVLLENLTINYNNPELYSEANIIYNLMRVLNIDSIQYLTMYPIYIVIPQEVSVLQVSLS